VLLLRSLPTHRRACFASIPCCKPAHGVCKPAHCVYKPVHGVCKPAFSDRSNPVCYYYGRYRHADLPATRASHVASQHAVCTSQHTVCASQHTVCTSPYTVWASQHLATVVIQCVITTVATNTPTGLLREHPMLQASTRCVCKPAHRVYKPVHGVCKPAFSNRSNPMCYYYGHCQHTNGPASRASHVASQHTVCVQSSTLCVQARARCVQASI